LETEQQLVRAGRFLLGLHKVPDKQSQHVNPTYRNIVGRNMSHSFGQPGATFSDMLGVVELNLTMFKLEPTTPNISQQGGQTRANMLRPAMLRYVALTCCDRLAGALELICIQLC